mmetsp:Transcript_8191/g.17885  ORF Transcript_8191/g.17885 Transcript_8191/m.17885 type:complete len:101 (+) Transcript_8191:935-1237(+)
MRQRRHGRAHCEKPRFQRSSKSVPARLTLLLEELRSPRARSTSFPICVSRFSAGELGLSVKLRIRKGNSGLRTKLGWQKQDAQSYCDVVVSAGTAAGEAE